MGPVERGQTGRSQAGKNRNRRLADQTSQLSTGSGDLLDSATGACVRGYNDTEKPRLLIRADAPPLKPA